MGNAKIREGMNLMLQPFTKNGEEVQDPTGILHCHAWSVWNVDLSQQRRTKRTKTTLSR
jgi:hypothetical protein